MHVDYKQCGCLLFTVDIIPTIAIASKHIQNPKGNPSVIFANIVKLSVGSKSIVNVFRSNWWGKSKR